MDVEPTLSGLTRKPDEEIEFWWNGKCYGNVLPEEIIDEALALAKKQEENGGNGNEEKR